ncbi:MAG TPA: glycosyltransferase [Thermomicrobiales bacterium]|nr:glycosyltransferase [Thermomicrobiales bacterium]
MYTLNQERDKATKREAGAGPAGALEGLALSRAGIDHIAVSVIVPTRNEAGNVAALVRRLEHALPSVAEVIFVDDSDDDTPAAIAAERDRARMPVRLLHRAPGERQGGLGGAVVLGLREARYEWACVMDGDLQHPPEVIPSLLVQAASNEVDLVIGSRYRADGSSAGLHGIRTAVSRGSTTATRLAFPRRLQKVSDPMSGFFLVRRSAIDVPRLRPLGFKILLEIIVRTPGLRLSEVGFTFGERFAGQSKASLREGVRFASHMATLRLGDNWLRAAQFLFVGATGIAINALALFAATEWLGMFYLVGVILATQASTLWNFAGTDLWVFRGRPARGTRPGRLLQFAVMNNLALLFRGPMVYVLTSGLGIHYLASNLFSLVALSIGRFFVADSLIWKSGETGEVRMYAYDIHGVVSVESDVWLPELEAFLSEAAHAQPTLRVRCGTWRHRRAATKVTADATGAHFSYDEGGGPLGFWIDVTRGETTEIVASPLLRHSPHVLYTNVVEPILRWTFVQRGYALVHGACVAFGSDAYLVTARTDTGKTTTILRLLDRQRRASDTGAFISDDLTLLDAEGHVFTYPKPLTISRHTVAAVNTPLLSRRERLGLFLQSRLHSRGGRGFALRLAQTPLPVATINTYVQWIVPPPKYHVQRLVPHVKRAPKAQLAGIFVIERGADGDMVLDPATALDILMTNCDDAYGFPPYPLIRPYLQGLNGHNLSGREREIVAQAITNVPARLMRSASMDWSRRIPLAVGIPERPRLPVEQPALDEGLAGATAAP